MLPFCKSRSQLVERRTLHSMTLQFESRQEHETRCRYAQPLCIYARIRMITYACSRPCSPCPNRAGFEPAISRSGSPVPKWLCHVTPSSRRRASRQGYRFIFWAALCEGWPGGIDLRITERRRKQRASFYPAALWLVMQATGCCSLTTMLWRARPWRHCEAIIEGKLDEKIMCALPVRECHVMRIFCF